MNRRQFLTRTLAAVPVVLATEQLIELLAPRRAIFLPPRGGWAHTGPRLRTDFTAYAVGDVVRIRDGSTGHMRNFICSMAGISATYADDKLLGLPGDNIVDGSAVYFVTEGPFA